MIKDQVRIAGVSMPLYSLNTLVIGSGAAALRCALSLHEMGQTEIAIATDRWGGGTSCRSGSDKQTYYKLSTSGADTDAALAMARDLAAGGSMHGDIALCEAAGSLPAFFDLVRLGVPFPFDRYGLYPGYKTDHDPRQRAASAGPYTSRLMAAALGQEVKKKKIKTFDRHSLVALLTTGTRREKRVVGALAIDERLANQGEAAFVVFNAVNVVLAAGAPGAIWRDSVYPEDLLGATGVALAAGAVAHNLTENQFGLAAVPFRWSVSGSYQQVMPRYVSLDENGGDEREFLNDYFPDVHTLADAIFLKGYQWPFDARRARYGGSSLIDLLVYHERVVKARRVFLDFTRNPGDLASRDPDWCFSLKKLGREAYAYLRKSKALADTPIARLQRLNPPAVEVFRREGIDLGRHYLEISVCAQHCNGGLRANIWWETSLDHLFAVGEACGTHGVYRPGGSALNAGQVGAIRAARYIAHRYKGSPAKRDQFLPMAMPQVESWVCLARKWLGRSRRQNAQADPRPVIQARMSACAGIIRELSQVRRACREAWALYRWMKEGRRVRSWRHIPGALRDMDLCLVHAVFLSAMREYLERGGKSRGSYLILDRRGKSPARGLERYAFSLNRADDFVEMHILEIGLGNGERLIKRWIPVRPIPEAARWFENLWEDFRQDRIIRKEWNDE